MRNIITYGTVTITDSQLYGGVKFSHKVNKEEDIHYGVIASAEISFTSDVNIPIGEEVTWKVKMMQYNQFLVKGIYYITSKEKIGTKYKYIACDKIADFDANATVWLKNFICARARSAAVLVGATLPIDDLFTSIITYIMGEDWTISRQYLLNTGYSYNLYDFLNINKWCEPMPAQSTANLQPSDINKMPQYTFRQLLGYLCELMCVNIQQQESNTPLFIDNLVIFPYLKKGGKYPIVDYRNNGKENGINIKDFQIKRYYITDFKRNDDEYRVINGWTPEEGDISNVYVIDSKNPFFGVTHQQVMNQIISISARLNNSDTAESYITNMTPFKIKLFTDKTVTEDGATVYLSVGDIVKLVDKNTEEATEAQTGSGEAGIPSQDTQVFCADAYTIDTQTRNFVLSSPAQKRLGNLDSFYIVSNSTSNPLSSQASEGKYLFKCTREGTGYTAWRIYEANITYEALEAIITSKEIDATGVTIEGTGKVNSTNYEIYIPEA